MNGRTAKRIRHALRKIGRDPREAAYEDRVVAQKLFVTAELDENGTPLTRLVPRITTFLVPTCGRAMYKHLKALSRGGL